MSRYIVGIDLGTTTTTLSYIDTNADHPNIEILPITQLDDEGKEVTLDHLPSFCYLTTKAQKKTGLYSLSFETSGEVDIEGAVVGSIARNLLSVDSDRVIHSAKSWLAHRQIDPRQKLLPWHSEALLGGDKLSPIEVSSYYLRHLRSVWNKIIAKDQSHLDLTRQRVTITLPASFDEVATSLTLEAAQAAGFSKKLLRVLEEPQAAFYSWLETQSKANEKHYEQKLMGPIEEFIKAGKTEEPINVLVCDIGGGTTDFSLFKVNPKTSDIERIAVSDHLLLGGDNIDLKIADLFENLAQESGLPKCTPKMWSSLVSQSRRLKEQILSSDDPSEESTKQHYVSLDVVGANLFAKPWTVSAKESDIRKLILDSFFPVCPRTSHSEKSSDTLSEWGLPYAHDSAFTRHLAEFLDSRTVEAVLFAGGSFTPPLIRQRITEVLGSWMGSAPVVLENSSMAQCVARGACLSEYWRAKGQTQISGGYARSLFLRVAQQKKAGEAEFDGAICILAQGHSNTDPHRLDDLNLIARTGQMVQFQLYSTNKKVDAKVGRLYDIASLPGAMALAPMQATLSSSSGKSEIAVGLEVALTSTGILHVSCYSKNKSGDNPGRWELSFNVQENHINQMPSYQQKRVKSQSLPENARQKSLNNLIHSCFESQRTHPEKRHTVVRPKELIRTLEKVTESQRSEWSIAELRSLSGPLLKVRNKRGSSPEHEVTWLNLLGYSLRPGTGSIKDQDKVAQVWSLFQQGVQSSGNKAAQTQWWIMWRRLSAGLSAAQQEKLFQKVYPLIRQGQSGREILMLAVSLERVDPKKKAQLGNLLYRSVIAGKPQGLADKIWALARLIHRLPLYGDAGCILTPAVTEPWLKGILAKSFPPSCKPSLVRLITQGGRLIGSREFDIGEQTRTLLSESLRKLGGSADEQKLLQEITPMNDRDRQSLFGENLPEGIILQES